LALEARIFRGSMEKAKRRRTPGLLSGIAESPHNTPRPPRLRVRLPEDLARGAAENTERVYMYWAFLI